MTARTLAGTTTSCLTVIKAIRVTKGLIKAPTMGRSMEDMIPGTEEGTVTVGMGILTKTGIMVFQRDSSVTITAMRILPEVQKVVFIPLPIGMRQTASRTEPLIVVLDIAHRRIHGRLRTINIRMVNVIMVVVGQARPPGIAVLTVLPEDLIESSILTLRTTTNELEDREHLWTTTPGKDFYSSKTLFWTAFYSHGWWLNVLVAILKTNCITWLNFSKWKHKTI